MTHEPIVNYRYFKLGVKFHVNAQAELTVQLSKRKEFHKENYSLVFESPNLLVPHDHAELRQRYEQLWEVQMMRFINNSNEVGTVYLYYR